RQESARSLAGLFPSPDFQRRRQLMLSMAAANAAEATADASSSSCCWRCQRCLPLKRFGIRAGRRRQDNRYAPPPTYPLDRRARRRRLESPTRRLTSRRFFEPQGAAATAAVPATATRTGWTSAEFGRHELRVRLIESPTPARFAPCSAAHHTGSGARMRTDGVDFEFTTRQEFQRRIREGGHFLETGQFNGDPVRHQRGECDQRGGVRLGVRAHHAAGPVSGPFGDTGKVECPTQFLSVRRQV
uniref:CSD domain-containing protein n=1 Tax=Macrostomum lignano TaxID=282301 RepID=A0A1I8FNS9_9PLAT